MLITTLDLRFGPTDRNIFLVLLLVAAWVGNLVESGLELYDSEDNIYVVRMLLRIISDTSKSKRLWYKQLCKSVNLKPNEQTETTPSRKNLLLWSSTMRWNKKFTTSLPSHGRMIALSDRPVCYGVLESNTIQYLFKLCTAAYLTTPSECPRIILSFNLVTIISRSSLSTATKSLLLFCWVNIISTTDVNAARKTL